MPTEGEAGQIGQNTQPGTAWQRVQNARHKDRPHTLDYIQRILTDFQCGKRNEIRAVLIKLRNMEMIMFLAAKVVVSQFPKGLPHPQKILV